MSADQARLAEAQRQLGHLASLPTIPGRIESVQTGELFRDRWERFAERERNQWLRQAGVRALVLQNPLEIVVVARGDIEESARKLTIAGAP